jgi:hypothetical protein
VVSSGTTLARGHLRLASVSAVPGPGRRLALRLRALAATFAVLWSTLRAWWAAAWALFPLLARPAPVGRRLRQRPPREARVIPFHPRRRVGQR